MTDARPDGAPSVPPARRVVVAVRGAVQGVGFRPFVHRLATSLGLSGVVRNRGDGAQLEVEGRADVVATFLRRWRDEVPPRAAVLDVTVADVAPTGATGFAIAASDAPSEATAVVLADGATCDACLAEVLDPADRRHRHPFASCTQCGPRFSIVTGLPYDRARTTMAAFPLCPACRAEYDDPRDRRFHAQPLACPACGPTLSWRDADGRVLADGAAALAAAVAALRGGAIVAAKGLGGFHLLCDARSEATVARLRVRKAREEKPFALLVRDLDAARALVEVPAAAAAALRSPVAPIVLLPRRPDADVAPAVAPGNPRLGVMLPATPLHHLLARDVGAPLVATSGNRSDEPICRRDDEALVRLAGVADAFLGHDRPVARPVDDAVLAVDARGPFTLRRARGLAPMPVRLAAPVPCVLALGGHLKGTVALSVGDQVVLSQHLGDLETPEALDAFDAAVRDLLALHRAEPVAVAHDLHPDYGSTRWLDGLARRDEPFARALAATPRVGVQHHHAHVAAALAEHRVAGRVLGFAWDGAGLGLDGTTWGGEAFVGDAARVDRVATLRPFPLPGGDAAARDPRRALLGVRFPAHGRAAADEPAVATLPPAQRDGLVAALERGVGCPIASSVGRLFDAAAAALGFHRRAAYEGQAATWLEHLADPAATGALPLPVSCGPSGTLVLEGAVLVEAVLDAARRGAPAGIIAMQFHRALVEALVTVARTVGEPRVVLTGGCFQNRLLRDLSREALEAAGHDVVLPRDVPCNDGGVALGQVVVAAARLAGGR